MIDHKINEDNKSYFFDGLIFLYAKRKTNMFW